MKQVWIIVPFLLMGCQNDANERQTVNVAKEFSLKAMQTIAIEPEQLTIRLQSVSNESRCPLKLRCVWEGNAQVNLKVRKTGKAAATIALNTVGMRKYPNEAKYLDYTFKLTKLEPYPTRNGRIPQSSYTATLLVSKAGQESGAGNQ